jgi:hypothetical protein
VNQHDWRVFPLAKQQHGVVSYAQLDALGVTRPARHFRLKTGAWVPVLPSVVRMYWADETWLLRAWAAMLWGGEATRLSHFSAAAIHGLELPQKSGVEITTAKFMSAPCTWLSTHRSGRASDGDTVQGLKVTPVARTLVDVASGLPIERVEVACRDALRRKLVSMAALKRELKSARVEGVAPVRRSLETLVRVAPARDVGPHDDADAGRRIRGKPLRR